MTIKKTSPGESFECLMVSSIYISIYPIYIWLNTPGISITITKST